MSENGTDENDSYEESEVEESESGNGEAPNRLDFDLPADEEPEAQHTVTQVDAFASFDFKFDDFAPNPTTDDSAFVFDVREARDAEEAEEAKKYQNLVELLSNSCFQVSKEALIRMFGQVDETASVESCFQIMGQ
jgi:hypothetical protein